jgi:hypothetical protein
MSSVADESSKAEKVETVDLSEAEVTTIQEERQITSREEDDLTIKARRANDAFLDLVTAAIDKAKTVASAKTKELMEKPLDPRIIAATKDANDIGTLGGMVEGLARTFEDTITEVRKYPYSEQVDLLTGYKKLLEEQINVIDSRLHMVKRLKNV